MRNGGGGKLGFKRKTEEHYCQQDTKMQICPLDCKAI